MIAAIGLTALLGLQGISASAPEKTERLQTVIESYWDHLQHRRKLMALEYVELESRQNFVRRQEPPFLSWKLIELQERPSSKVDGSRRMLVTVEVRRIVQDGVYPWKVREEWVRTEEGWKVEIGDAISARKNLWTSDKPVEPRNGVVDVGPEVLRLHFFSGSQTGSLWLRNGSRETVQITSLIYDARLFELLESPEKVPSGGVGKIRLRYVGTEKAKNLKSGLVIQAKTDSGAAHTFSVPVRYNVISRAAMGLLRLSAEDAQALERGQTVAVPRRKPNPEGY